MKYKLMVQYKCNPDRGIGSGFDQVLEVVVKKERDGSGTAISYEPMRDLDWFFETEEERDTAGDRLRSTIKDIEISTSNEKDED